MLTVAAAVAVATATTGVLHAQHHAHGAAAARAAATDHAATPTTVRDASANAFGYALPGLTAAQRRSFVVGNSFFKQNWVQAPASAAGRDGLGPLFNARSCSSCHRRDGRSAPPAPGDVDRSGLLLRIGVARADGGPDAPHPVYGTQLQDVAIPGVAAEARVQIDFDEVHGVYGDGEAFTLLRPRYTLHELGYGDVGPGAVLGARVAPHLVGLGLLEAVPAAMLHAWADPDDRDGDGISGRVARLGDGADAPIGRFGWKATQADVAGQTAAAFVHDMGITSHHEPREATTTVQRSAIARVHTHGHTHARATDAAATTGTTGAPAANAPAADGGATAPEIADAAFAHVVLYTRALAVPAPRDVDAPAAVAGAAHFRAFGCAACHVPECTTGAAAEPAFARRRIAPFTDLLLHDLGEGLADGKRDGAAAPGEWRTAPLWGLGLVPTVNGHSRYLHDGRARDFAEAVLWHGGEAHAARERFRLAPRAQRAELLAFLAAL